MKNSLHKTRILHITVMTGLILFVLTCVFFSVFYFINRSSTKEQRQTETFNLLMREYDILSGEMFSFSESSQVNIEQLSRELDRMEKLALSVESWLSVLKRRRHLSLLQPRDFMQEPVLRVPPSVEKYEQSLNRALELYPMSASIAALAVENLVKGTAISGEARERLRLLIPALNLPENNDLRLALHILLGDFRNPSRAVEHIPYDLFSDGTESVTVDLILLKILRGDIREAAADIQYMFYSLAPSIEALRFTAEFIYDFGDLRRSAEIFTLIDDEKAMRRAADALYLSDYRESARTIWSLLSSLPCRRSLYNLGVTSDSPHEAASYFEKMIAGGEDSGEEDSGSLLQFGIIRYSRYLEIEKAIELLEKNKGKSFAIDFELCRRQAEWWEAGRQIAETWMLIERYEKNEGLYRWAAWLFLSKRNYSELDFLLRQIDNINLNSEPAFSEWAAGIKAIRLMIEGDIEKAESNLRSISDKNTDWTVFANSGRILEANRRPAPAIEQYELALLQNPAPIHKARVQIGIARCFSGLNQPGDARRALQNALESDPENLTARMLLDRL